MDKKFLVKPIVHKVNIPRSRCESNLPRNKSFEDTLQAFMQSQQIINAQIAKNVVDIIAQFGELTTIMEALQQEPVWEEDTHCEEENSEVCKAQS